MGAVTGFVVGGLVWAGLDLLGIWSALKFDFLVGALAIAVIVGAIAGLWLTSRRVLWTFAALIVLALVLVSFTPIAPALAHPLVRADSTSSGKLDAVVILSGGITGDNAMDSQTLDRLLKGLEVQRESAGSALVISRETFTRGGRVISDSADQARVLALTGVTAPVLYIDSASSTRDEALRVKRLPASRAWKRIALVTSPLHTRRACAVFERVGFTVTCIPAESRERTIKNAESTGERLGVFQGWLYEFAGTTRYRMKGWI